MPIEMNLTPSEELLYTTTRIESNLADGTSCTGTGFFFNFLNDGRSAVPAVVTNKHVVEGAVTTHFIINTMNSDGGIAPERIIIDGPGEGSWMPHPDPDVDLCIFPMAAFLSGAQERGFEPFFKAFDSSIIPDDPENLDFSCIGTITMIGYPNGIWDEKNNLPIVRRGITATPFKFDYQGRREFVIDAACFPGSSGSPVVIFEEGLIIGRDGIRMGGSRVMLLGILYSGPLATAQGSIVFDSQPHVEMKTMMNLGHVIKADRLLEFEPILSGFVGDRPERE